MTEKQLRANKRNALRGGVKTQRGKQIVRFNAVKHGLLSRLLTKDEAGDAVNLQAQLLQEYQPQTQLEKMLIENIVVAHIRWQRAIHAEKEFFLEVTNPTITEDRYSQPHYTESEDQFSYFKEKKDIVVVSMGHVAQVRSEQVITLETTYARYVTTCERQFYRALREFQRLYCFRAGRTFSLLTSE
jgi:hypothetical protein